MEQGNDITAEIAMLPAPTLEQLERQITAALHAIWKAQGKDKEIIDWSKKRDLEKRGLSRFDRR